MRSKNAVRPSARETSFAVSVRPKIEPMAKVTIRSKAFMVASVLLPVIRRMRTRAMYIAVPTTTMRSSGFQPEKKKSTLFIM
jgi:hypothetical protein